MIPYQQIMLMQEDDEDIIYHLHEICNSKEQQNKSISRECEPLEDGDEEDD